MLQNLADNKGWEDIISSSKLVDKFGPHTDNSIEVDIPMLINPEDSISDALIERAILELQLNIFDNFNTYPLVQL
jgi:hypothetical protein